MLVPVIWIGLPRSWSWLVWAGLAGALVATVAIANLSPARFGVLAVVLIAANLLAAGIGFNPATPHPNQPVTGAIAYLRRQSPSRFVSYGAFTLPPNVGMRYGLYDARSYDQPIERHFYRLWTTAIQPGFPGAVRPHLDVPTLTPRALTALGLLSVKDILVAPSTMVPSKTGLVLAYRGRDAKVYANPGALPRAFVASSQYVVANQTRALATVESPRFYRNEVVVTDHRLPGLPTALASPGTPGGSAAIVSYSPEQVRIAVYSQQGGELVLTDDYFPGWTAAVNNTPTTIDRVDYLFRGVHVGPGASIVTFRYRPAGWTAGWITSVIALIAWLALLVYAIRTRRRDRASRPRRVAQRSARAATSR
jgi:hypothetical protein